MSAARPRRRRPARAARSQRVVVDAPAKLNLGLAVGSRRPDGFHELATVFQAISLHDTLMAERTDRRGFRLRVVFENAAERGAARPKAGEIPSGAGNLVLQAARALAARAPAGEGVSFTLIKRIPAGAGLGGGSADAAAALRALDRLWGVRATAEQLRTIAARLGSDVPFALRGGTAGGLGRGDRLIAMRLARSFQAVVAVPRWRVSTALAYRRLDRLNYGLTRSARYLRFVQHIGRERTSIARAIEFGNTFEQVLGARRARFESLKRRLMDAGFISPQLTGSGSAVFAIAPRGDRARRMVQDFTGDEALFLVRPVASGPRCRREG